jgi:hypothetical protein
MNNTLTTQMVSATFHQIIHYISSGADRSFQAFIYKSFADFLKVNRGPSALSQEFGIIDETLADQWKNRSQRSASELADDKEDLVLIDEIKNALEDIAKLLYYMDAI